MPTTIIRTSSTRATIEPADSRISPNTVSLLNPVTNYVVHPTAMKVAPNQTLKASHTILPKGQSLCITFCHWKFATRQFVYASADDDNSHNSDATEVLTVAGLIAIVAIAIGLLLISLITVTIIYKCR